MLRRLKPQLLLTSAAFGLFFSTSSGLLTSDAYAQQNSKKASSPSLIITSGPIPESLRKNLYTKPTEVPVIDAKDILKKPAPGSRSSVVTSQIREFSGILGEIQSRITALSGTLKQLERSNEQRSAGYYANVATINTQLQTGTTPGNPRLTALLESAEGDLEDLGASLATMNSIALDSSKIASEAAYLLENARAAYSVSGALEEDHVKLSELEDSINNTIIMIERVLNTVNDDITRMTSYLASERNNLRTLALAVSNGDLYGTSLANRPFSNVAAFSAASVAPQMAAPARPVEKPAMASSQKIAAAPASSAPDQPILSGSRALAKIKFNRPNVNYEQPIYMAVTEALERYPNARFELVAVNPTQGNAAEIAIETTKARRNAEKVLRTLTQMGLSTDRIDLSYDESASAASSEVHLFIK